MWEDGITGTELGSGNTFYQPELTTVADQSSGWSFSDALKSVTSTANDLVGVWQGVKTTENKIAQQQFQNELQSANLDLQKTVALGSVSVQQAQARAAIDAARRQATNSLNAPGAIPNAVVNAKNGVSLGMIALVGAGLWFFMKAKA